MVYHLYALLIISFVLVLAAIKQLSLYSPLVVNSIVWFFVFLAGLFFNDRFYSLTDEVFIAWLIWFLLGSLIYFLLYPSRRAGFASPLGIREIPLDYSILLLALIGWLIYKIWYLGTSGAEGLFLNLRLSAIQLEGFESMGLLGWFYPFVFALFLFEHVYARKENKKIRLLLWGWMLLYAVATMGKFAVLTPIVSWFFIQGIKDELRVRMVVLISFFAIFLMLLLHFVRAGDSDESTILDVIAIYIYSPLVALGYMDVDGGQQFGAYVFRFVYAVGGAIGANTAPAEVILPYVVVPELTNVYTVMHSFYHDFKFFGVVFGSVFYSILFSIMYAASKSGSGISLAIFSGLSIALVGQFIGELILSMLAGHLYVIIILMCIWVFSKRINCAS